MLDEALKEQLRRRLVAKRNHLVGLLHHEEGEVIEIGHEQSGENTYGSDPMDDGVFLDNIDNITTLEVNIRHDLEQVEKAVSRMKDGSYGFSEVSGQPIPVERLQALPWATKLVGE